MSRLVELTERSRYADGAHGETSMHGLHLAQTASANLNSDPHLRISPRFDWTIEFRYIDTHVKTRQWHRVVSEDEAFARLVRFFSQLRWFATERPKSGQS